MRILDALTGFIADWDFFFTAGHLAQRAQVTPTMAKLAIDEWLHQGWITAVDKAIAKGFVITAKAPTAPNEAAIDAIALLEAMDLDNYRLHRLAYGFGSALSFQGMTELVQKDIYVIAIDQTVTPFKKPSNRPFARSTKAPTLWGEWRKQRVYRIRRRPELLRAYQRLETPYQGVKVPCTAPLRTLIDCWVRPDLAGGEDRVNDAWKQYLEANPSTHDAIGREIAAILQDSYAAAWPAMKMAFEAWISSTHLSLKHRRSDES